MKHNVMKQIFFSVLVVPYTMHCVTDKDLPHIDPYQAGELYALMMTVDMVLKKHAIHYWAGWGTLLGAIRHQGLIPWDDDLDVAIFDHDIATLEKLEPLLQEIGLTLLSIEKENNIDYYKIFPTDGQAFEEYPWRYPFVDIFPMTIVGKKVQYTSKRLRDGFEKEYFQLAEVRSFPLNKTQFGPMEIPIPHNARNILTRLYGDDWNEVAYAKYDHKHEKELEIIEVPLIERAHLAYILPH